MKKEKIFLKLSFMIQGIFTIKFVLLTYPRRATYYVFEVNFFKFCQIESVFIDVTFGDTVYDAYTVFCHC